MDFPISAQALADAALVIPAVAWARKMFPKLDGWMVVAVVAALSVVAGIHAAGRPVGTLEYAQAAGLHAVMVFAGSFGGWNALKKALESAQPPALPPSIPPSAIVLIAFLGLAPVLTGCGASLQDAAETLNAANTIATEAQPCLVAERQREAAACNGDATCEATVTAHWAPVADAYDALHAGWCALVPDAEGCP